MAIFEARITKDFGDELTKIRASHAEELRTVRGSHAETVKILIGQSAQAATPKPRSKGSEKLSEKSYKRMDKLAGGEANWQDWRYDFEVLTGVLNPEVARELVETAKPEPRTGLEIQTDGFLIPEDNWEPAMTSKELRGHPYLMSAF